VSVKRNGDKVQESKKAGLATTRREYQTNCPDFRALFVIICERTMVYLRGFVLADSGRNQRSWKSRIDR